MSEFIVEAQTARNHGGSQGRRAASSAGAVHVIGAGLAGCEAAARAVKHGLEVTLWEMKPEKFSPAHKLETFAELVCSNSLRSDDPASAVGLLKEELRRLGSLCLAAADQTSVPAGKALAVDRLLFSRAVTEAMSKLPGLRVERAEVTEWPEGEGPVVVAGGPLSSEALTKLVGEVIAEPRLYFYDALAPIVTFDSLDMTKIFRADRYGDKDGAAEGGDYLNCPFDKDEFSVFLEALISADEVAARDFENFAEAAKFFEGCLPVEVMARRGPRTLTFGPMKPVGLDDPRTGRRPYAVVQLRRENQAGTLWNLVGFQTRLTRPAQEKVFRLIPGLERAEFARFGAIHRNTYLDAPKVLDEHQRFRAAPRFFAAGQFSGVEGYVESAAHGLWAGENAARSVLGLPLVVPPPSTASGALLAHLRDYHGRKYFAPSNVNFGLFPPPPAGTPKNGRSAWLLETARRDFSSFLEEINYAS